MLADEFVVVLETVPVVIEARESNKHMQQLRASSRAEEMLILCDSDHESWIGDAFASHKPCTTAVFTDIVALAKQNYVEVIHWSKSGNVCPTCQTQPLMWALLTTSKNNMEKHSEICKIIAITANCLQPVWTWQVITVWHHDDNYCLHHKYPWLIANEQSGPTSVQVMSVLCHQNFLMKNIASVIVQWSTC